MRSDLIALRVAGVAVALTALSAVTTVTAPVALANGDDRGGVSADPDPAHPGAQVKLRVRGCDGDRASATSSAFVSEIRLGRGHGGGSRELWGDAHIRSDAWSGRHEIRVRCDDRDDREVRGSLEVEHHPSHHATPIWPVHAGGGAMAAELAAAPPANATTAKKDHDTGGPGLPHTVIGAVLAAAATLAVAGRALALRRRRSGE
ncbi:hypothetical protein OHS33_13350 [Streptomyces sp. NBC_00536]|uniref:hypothetical protein n=1 Tax=Streptomyces sp. NBC_00536 TaxID=2975769 RepID=UPI002E803A82|nr:hypothetical protein [Streptomyces sp. NBC_00536]WUC79238.1 hypothetical protein OHS33_13350 [Streptomyces sp. NBC_00536]